MADIVACVTEPAKTVGKWIGEQLYHQLAFIWFFTANITALKEQFQKLNDDTAELEGEVQTARDNRSQKPVPRVTTWLTNSNNLKVEINAILNEAENVGSGVCSNVGARFSLSKRAKETTERTEKLRAEKPSAHFQPGPTAATQEVELGKTFECESRNVIEEDIMTTLKDVNKYMIGICGMGGLGKTTMATKIMNKALREGVFQEGVIVTFGQKVDISEIQVYLGDKLGLDTLKDANQTKRADMLQSRLRDTKRTLLVLDDVWDTPPLKSIGIPGDSEWCTILFTSRNRDVLRAMDGVQVFGMDVLSEDEAWSFFKEKVGSCAKDKELKDIPKQVAKECGGLPINLAAVGAVLKDKRNAAIWKNTLIKLKKNVTRNVRYDRLQQTYNPLKLSYEYLKSEDHSKAAASVFLLCCLFPEDADIPLDYLTYFSMGLGGIFEDDDITTMEEAWYSMCEKTELLKDRSLLLESDKKDCVRMHDVVRDVCTLIAEEERYIGKVGGRWISSSHLVGLSNELLPNLNVLFLNRRYDWSGFKFDDTFQKGMTELNVLCIEKYHLLTTLPHPTQSLGNLKTLILDSCEELKTISVVGELVNLEILICRNCYGIEKLPVEMKRLNRLKLLELTWCINLQSIERGIISSLVALEELKMLDSFKGWEVEGSEERENASIKELEALPNLACLEIQIRDPSVLTENMPRLSKKIGRFVIICTYFRSDPSFSKAISVCLERETRLGDWIEMQLVRDTEFLYLEGGANNVDFAKCQNIRWLELSGCESMKNVVRTSGGSDDADVFLLIEHLKLDNLPELQEICDGPISSATFQNLKELKLGYLSALTQFWKSSCVPKNNNVPYFSNLSSIEIYECHSLRNLGQLSMAGKDCLPQLEELDIAFCEMMEQVFLWNDDEEEAGENKTSILITKVFPKLKMVKLEDLPNLTTLYQGIQGIEFPLLTEMKIEKCPKMKIMIDGSSSADNDEDGYLHLSCQPQKAALNPFEISVSLFNGLETLVLNEYKGSVSLFSPSAVENLVNLKALLIERCDEMVKVIEDEEEEEVDGKAVSGGEIRSIVVFPKLEELGLCYLPKLESFCEWKRDVELPSLRLVQIDECPNMEKFSMRSVATPNLVIVQIDEEGIDARMDLNVAVQQRYLARQEKGDEEEESSEEENEIEEDGDQN